MNNKTSVSLVLAFAFLTASAARAEPARWSCWILCSKSGEYPFPATQDGSNFAKVFEKEGTDPVEVFEAIKKECGRYNYGKAVHGVMSGSFNHGTYLTQHLAIPAVVANSCLRIN